MAVEGTQFVTGFVCPTCQHESVGIPMADNSGRRQQSWTYRLPDTDDLQIQCTTCKADVPREHWQFKDS